MMTRERIEDFREIVLPFLSRTLLKTNYENMGKSDAEEFEKDFNEILDLANKALEQEPCIQEKQANADKTDAVYIDGFKAGYSQARFDLKQEPVLDKIRAEIAVLDDADYDYEGYYKAVMDAVKIIDKYKTEGSEE